MIYLETEHLYYNTQVYFRKHMWVDMPNHERIWGERYRAWLAEQGCTVVDGHSPVLRNSLGVAPGFDYFAFENEQDAAMFALRWS